MQTLRHRGPQIRNNGRARGLDAKRAIKSACRGVEWGRIGLDALEQRQLLTLLIDLRADEGAGTLVKDYALPAESYDFINGEQWVAARAGAPDQWAVNLDGSNWLGGSSDVAPIVGGTASVSFWIKTTAAGSNDPTQTGAVFGTAEGTAAQNIFWGYLNATGRIAFQVPDATVATVTSTRPINDGAWHHVSMTRDTNSGEIRMYVDGLLNATATGSTSVRNTFPIIDLGRVNSTAGPRFLNAQLDQIRVDDAALTAAEVGLLFNPSGQPPVAPANLAVAYSGARAVQLTWTPSPNTSEYEVWRRDGGAGDFVLLPTRATGSSFFDTGLAPSTQYEYQLRAVNPAGTSPASNTVSTTTTELAAPGTGTGLLGVYYDNGGVAIPGSNPAVIDPASNFNGRIETRIDPTVNFITWGTGQPHPEIGPNNFSTRWLGEVEAQYNEPYTFCVSTDDGSNLYLELNGTETQLINDPFFHGLQAAPGLCSVAVNLTAGQRYNIRFEQFEGGGGAGAVLRWSSPSQGTEVIPQTQLYPLSAPAPTGTVSGLTANATGPDTIELAWTENAEGELGYRVYRSPTGAAGSFVEVGTTADLTFIDSVLPNATYFYQVTAFHTGGETAPSNTASATTGPRVISIQYNLDEGTGTTVTNSAPGGGFAGTLVNGATWVAGDSGAPSDSAVDFAGGTSDQSLETDDLSAILGGTASLTAWIRTTQSGNNTMWQAPGITGVEQAGAGNDIFWGWLNVAGNIGFQVGNDPPVQSDEPINDGQWHHVAMTRNSTSGELRLYVDGVLQGTVINQTGQVTSTFNSFGVISRVNNDLSEVPMDQLPDSVWLDGALDDIRVYDSILTHGEIRQMLPLTAPTGVTAVGGDAAVQLNWEEVSAAETYNIKRSTTAGGPYTTVATGVIGTSYLDSGLTNGTAYYYVISGANALAEGPNSAEVSATPQVAIPPAAPVVTATASLSDVELSWEAVPFATSYNVKRSATAGGPYTLIGSTDTTSFTDEDVSQGTTYYYVVSSVNTAGEGANSAEVAATTLAIPAPWANQDIGTPGNPALPGSAGLDVTTETWRISGGGTDIWNPEDHFHYLYQPVTGDFSIRAHVIDMTGGPILGGTTTDPWSKAGVMIREELTAGSQHAYNATTPGNQVHFQGRLTTGDTANSFNDAAAGGSQNFNGWVRLDRVGNVVTAYWSPTGVDGSWVSNGTRDYTATGGLEETLFAGLAISSHDNTELSTALVDNVRIIMLSVPPTAAPTNVVATAVPGNRAVVMWSDSNDTETGFRLERSSDGGTTWQLVGGDLPNSSTTYIDSGLSAGEDYMYRVRAFNTFGETANSVASAATIAGVGAAAPAPWSSGDIGTAGDPAFPGVSAYLGSEESFEVGGSGSDVWNPEDHFHYLYQTLTGDGSITAQVLNLQNTDAWAKGGVMIRGELTAGSWHAFNAVTAANQVHFQGRPTTGDTTNSFNDPAPAGSQNMTGWVRLVRAGDDITAFWSPTGAPGSWVQNGTRTYAGMPETVYVGLAVTSHDNTEVSTAFFDNVVIETGPAGIHLTGTAAADNWHLKRNGDLIEVRNNADGSGAAVSTHALGSDFSLSGGDGDDTVTVDLSGGDISLGAFVINGDAGGDRVRLINGDGRTLTIGGVPTLNGKSLDLGTGDLKVTGATAAAVEALVATARAGATRWQGPGIGTTAATAPNTGLAVATVGSDVIVKFSYDGDANVDGLINADDYFRIDSGFLDQPLNPTYAQGDFNFDDTINADDYFLIDSAFLGQGTPLASASAAVTSTASAAAEPVIPDNEGTKKARRVANDNSALFSSRRIEKRSARRGR